ncbi:hypothetical protein D3C86_931580 [compost metagenome]
MRQPDGKPQAQQQRQRSRQAHQGATHRQHPHGPRQGAPIAPVRNQGGQQGRADGRAESIGGDCRADRLDLGVQAVGHGRDQAGHHEFRKAESEGADGEKIDSDRHGVQSSAKTAAERRCATLRRKIVYLSLIKTSGVLFDQPNGVDQAVPHGRRPLCVPRHQQFHMPQRIGRIGGNGAEHDIATPAMGHGRGQ